MEMVSVAEGRQIDSAVLDSTRVGSDS